MSATLERADLPRLFEALQARGYRVVGPTLRDGAIVYDTLAGVADLPAGWTDAQEGGTYRLTRRNDAALFGYAVGPHSWKKFLFPPEERIFRARRTEDGFEVLPEEITAPKLAFLGVRSCEIQAIAIQDKVFIGGPFADRSYQLRRENVFIVAVHCGQAGGTCFCVSMKTGPKATGGFDLALTEILDRDRHYFVVESGSDAGAEVLAELPQRPAEEFEVAAADAAVARAASQMGRTLDTNGIKELLYRNLEHPRWDDVANRCLSCANCHSGLPDLFLFERGGRN